MESSDYKAVMGVSKRLLKDKGISYKDLARELGLSESGVKKLFLASDCSFQRILQLSQIVGANLIDVLDEVHRADPRRTSFSQAQQEAFLDDMALFNFFYKLVIERMPLPDIKKHYKLDQKVAFKYLRRLDQLRLIKLMPEDQIKLPSLQVIKDFGPGPFMDKLYQKWGSDMVRELASPSQQKSGKFIVRCLKMRDSTYEEFLTQLRNVEIEFTRRGVREMGVFGQELKPMKWVSMTDQGSFVEEI